MADWPNRHILIQPTPDRIDPTQEMTNYPDSGPLQNQTTFPDSPE